MEWDQLSKEQQRIWSKARAVGSGGQAVRLTDPMCGYLLARIILDLGLSEAFPEVGDSVPDFFDVEDIDSLALALDDPRGLYSRLVAEVPDAVTYFACLANLHKSRLKYEKILETQALPTLEQVGPRGLLQFGKLPPSALVCFLFWRKWFFDIDNRAGQETGYLFEPILAHAIGGTPVSGRNSPVKRVSDRSKGRQVDCLLEPDAYEFKLRVTIAASGQGRWGEEIDFPADCRASGFNPVLVVLDPTPNPKLAELRAAFEHHGGQVYIGADAWRHLDERAGPTMASFIEQYVRRPLDELVHAAPAPENEALLPEFIARHDSGGITISIGGQEMRIVRPTGEVDDSDSPVGHDEAPAELDEEV